MGKIDQVTRDKAVDLLGDLFANGYADDNHDNVQDTFKDIFVKGVKGLIDYSDEEIADEFRQHFEDSNETAILDLIKEMDAQIAIHNKLTEEMFTEEMGLS